MGNLEVPAGMRFLAVAALVCLGLAGCTSSPEPREPEPTSVFTSTATLSDLPPKVPVSDTMYLLDAPHMMATLPIGPVVRTAIPTSMDHFPSTGDLDWEATWTLPRDNLPVLEGNLTFWVEVRGSVTNPNAVINFGDSCFWFAMLMVAGSDRATDGAGHCADEPQTVPEGIREIHIPFGTVDVSQVTGDMLEIRMSTPGIYSNGATVDLLAGSPEYPSRLALRGLTLPLDTQTYL